MKKIFMSIIACVVSLSAATNEEILSLYDSAKADGVKVEIESRKALPEDSGIDLVVVKFTKDDQSQKDIVFTKGNFIYPDILDIKKQMSYKNFYSFEMLKSSIANVYKQEKPENILKIGNDKNKDTMVVFTDPECPYCRMEVNALDETLKNYNVEMIFTSVHGDLAVEKAALILQKSKRKSDKEKIEITRKYYAQDAKVDGKVDGKIFDSIKASSKKYFDAGLTSVPTKILKSEMK
ncbi:thioredoxin domain-containing protein [Campylobacter sp. RM12327]|uniref:thioredoxin domain-containing protein n=1 Tax=Campylobacter sputorum TaxID=206 RepID=UPI000B77165D|nr:MULTISPECIES: thioredoxin domain-containing protein [Campylobacter]ASM39623.1 DsbA family protein [Campylobacter sputorum]MBE7358325.1 thioredoxin domain-containing protein [Campylobacter sp. RM11302]MBF6669487.1 thioredoxin domain-containing protein [Campylobacter sp. RM12327]MBF6674770.1 thioredoxin domain-containing protein [Campylobacter sp. RM13538]MBF6676622.1 thioredoxin domain-containing protein [Campylobacter sp. RM12321]